MAGPPTADEGMFTFVFTGEGFPTGAQCTQAFTWADTAFSAIAAIATELEAVVTATLSDAQILESVTIKQGPVDTGFSVDFPLGFQGGQGSGGPPQACGIVRKVVPTGSGRQQGRLFWPAGSDDSIFSNGTLNPLTISSWDGVFNDMLVAAEAPFLVIGNNGTIRAMSDYQTQPRSGTLKQRNRR